MATQGDVLCTVLVLSLSLLLLLLWYACKRVPLRYRNRRLQWNANAQWHAECTARQLYKCPLLVDIEGLAVGFKRGQVHISLDKATVWWVVGDRSAEVVAVKPRWSFWRKKVASAVQAVIVFCGKRLVLHVSASVQVRLCSKGEEASYPDRLYYFLLDIGPSTLAWTFTPTTPVSIGRVEVKEECQTDTRVESKTVVSIPKIALSSCEGETLLDLGDRIDVDISSSFMLLVGSFLDRQAKKIIVEEDKGRTGSKLEIPLPDIDSRLLPIQSLVVTISIPTTDPDLCCLDHCRVVLRDISGQLCIQNRIPYFCIDVSRGSLGARCLSPKVRSASTYSRADCLFGQVREGDVQLVSLENMCISNYGVASLGFSAEQLAEYIAKVAQGKGPWWWRERSDFKDDEHKRRLNDISTSLAFDVDREELGLSSSSSSSSPSSSFNILILATVDTFRMTFPSEFPFGFLLDHLAYIHKVAMQGEAWDVLSTAELDFLLRLSVKHAAVVFEDDEMDLAIGRCLQFKQSLLKLIDVEGSDCESVFQKYMQICKARTKEIPDNDLLKLQGSDLVLQLQWKHEWAASGTGSNEGMARLLGGMSEEQELSASVLSKVDTLVGGQVDLSVDGLSVAFRDYALPLLDAPSIRLHGLLFILELLPDANTIQRFAMPVYPAKLSSNLSRAAQGEASVLKNINPIKVFHCVNCVLHGVKMSHVAFSPRWLPALQQMDRMTENFASPAADPSPILPIWDKVRFLLRGSYSAVNITTPCHFDLLLSDDLQSFDDRATIILPEGTSVEQRPKGRVMWDIPSGLLTVNSQRLSLLRHHLSTGGSCFSKHDKRECRYLGESAIFLASLPKCRIRAQFKFKNAANLDCVDHFAVRSVCRDYTTGAHDSFADFRANHVTMKLAMDESAVPGGQDMVTESPMAVCYYRELEEWIAQSFARIIDIPCKKGTLWQTAFVPQHRPIDIKRYLRDINLRVMLLSKPLEMRMLSLYSIDQFSGLLVRASGFYINYHWRRRSNQYRTMLGKWDIADGRIACFASVTQATASEYAVKVVEGVAGVEVLRAPVISFNSINETLLGNSPADLEMIHDMALKMERSLKADTDAGRRSGWTPEVTLTRIHYLKESVRKLSSKGHCPIARRLYTAYDPNVSWDECSRDTVYAILYQQIVRQESRFARSRNMEKLIDEVLSFFTASPLLDSAQSLEKRAASPPATVDSDVVARFFAELLEQARTSKTPKIAEPDFSHVGGKKNMDLRAPFELAALYDLPGVVQIKLVNPQIAFSVPLLYADDFVKARAVLLVVPEATVETSQIFRRGTYKFDRNEDEQRPIGRRVRMTVADAQLFVVPAEHTGSVFYDHNSTPPRYSRITDQISITCVYDMAYSAATVEDPLFSTSNGDSFKIYCPSFAIKTKSIEFAAVLDCITRLLVYRDRNMGNRAERKAEVYRKAVTGRTEAVHSLAEFVQSTKQQCDALDAELGDAIAECRNEAIDEVLAKHDERLLELSVLAEALLAMRNEQKRFSGKQTRLSIELILEEAAWTLLEDDGSRMVGLVLTGVRDDWLSDSDNSVGMVFEIASVTADAAVKGQNLRILEAMSVAHAERLGLPLPNLTPHAASSIVRFSFKAGQAKAVGTPRCIEHAEFFLSPLRLTIRQQQASQLFRFFFPDYSGYGSNLTSTVTSAATSQSQSQTSVDKTAPKHKEKIDFTVITVPASAHLISYKAGAPDDDVSIMDVTDFLLKLPDLEYTNEQCTWGELALKMRNDAILIMLKNAGSLLKQKFQSPIKRAARAMGSDDHPHHDAVRQFYKEEALPEASDEEEGVAEPKDADRKERVEQVAKSEMEKKGRFLFGRYFHK